MGKLMVLKQNQEHRIHFHYYDILNCKSLVLYLEQQFPYPSVFYPEGQLTDVGGFLESIGTQLPLLKVNPDAHETELAGGKQFPNPSVEKPDGQSEGNGFVIRSGTHYELLSLWNPELHPDDGGTTGVEGVY